MMDPTARKLANGWTLRLTVEDEPDAAGRPCGKVARWYLIHSDRDRPKKERREQVAKVTAVQVSDTTALACILNMKGSR